MIVDASALIAILREEPDADDFLHALQSERGPKCISAVNYVEASIIVDGSRDPVWSRSFDRMLSEFEISVSPVTVHQAHLAREAYRDFGRGSGHAARLNMGDCFAYALAKENNQPLLFKGADFIHTDLQSALIP